MLLAFSRLLCEYYSGTPIKYDSLQYLFNRRKSGADLLHRVGLSSLPVNSVMNMTYNDLSTTSGQLLQYPCIINHVSMMAVRFDIVNRCIQTVYRRQHGLITAMGNL